MAGVFVLTDQQTLVPMSPAQFAKEDDFQRLLESFPALLSWEQNDGSASRRWLLVAREIAVPDEEDGSGRWFLDHLFLDQDGIPTLVEVKRQSDTRLRREVVGQMLDYAANAAVYWRAEKLREDFESTWGDKADERIKERLGLEDADAFWQRVKTNLQAHRIRLLFVADYIPPELLRVVEFLNEQMDPTEVLALELRQYEGQGLKTLVPVIYGQTQQAQDKKSPNAASRQWDEAMVFSDLQQRCGSTEVETAKRLVEWMHTKADDLSFGRGTKDGSISPVFVRGDYKLHPLSLYTNGKIMVNFGYILKPPFDDPVKRRELLNRLNEIEGIKLPEDAIDRYPTFPLQSLSATGRLDKFLATMNWFADLVHSS